MAVGGSTGTLGWPHCRTGGEEFEYDLSGYIGIMLKKLQTIGLTYLASWFPDFFWHRYGRQARKLGLKRLYLILSFDCDTPEDIKAAEQVDGWLDRHGIKRTYAVPGEQLEQGAIVYRRLAEKGAHFINHGASSHTEWRENRYWSVNFYNKKSYKEIREDIQYGHETIERVIGRSPNGFRTPHFGLFQAPEQLKMLHSILKELNYRYSTSTVPYFGFYHGPIWNMDGFYEIPLSGSYHSFLSLLDSWSYITDPYQPMVQDRYANSLITTVERLLAMGVYGVLNYYVDPFHVYRSHTFFNALEFILERQIPTLHYEELLGLAGEQKY